MSNPLQSSGPIKFSELAATFGQPSTNISMTQYLRGGSIVKNIYQNRTVPAPTSSSYPLPKFAPVKLSNYYGAADFYLKVKFNIIGETTSEPYRLINDGQIQVTVDSTTYNLNRNYTVEVIGKTSQTTNINNNVFTFNGLNGPQTYQVRVTNNNYNIINSSYQQTSYLFNVKVNYGTGTGGSVDGFTLNTWHDIDTDTSPLPPPPVLVPSNYISDIEGMEKIITFANNELIIF